MASTQSEGISADEARQLFETHEYLRTWRWWLGLLGLLLLGWVVRLVATYPTRTPLAGYRYQQVGVQAGKPRLWWVLAYRGSRAELLFSTDTSRGWQRHDLGVDSSQARGLALDWGGRALLVGDSAMRVYDARWNLAQVVAYELGPAFRGRQVAAEAGGRLAVVLGKSGGNQFTKDGGRTWESTSGLVTPADLFCFDNQRGITYWGLAGGYIASPIAEATIGTGSRALSATHYTAWYRPPRSALVGLGTTPAGDLLAVDQRGTWVTKSRVDSTSSKFAGRLLSAAWAPDSVGKFLAITATQIFWGKISKQLLASASPVPPAAKALQPAAAKKKASVSAATVPKKAKPKVVAQPARRPQKLPASPQKSPAAPPPVQQKPASELPSQGTQPTQSPVQNPVQQSSPQNQVPSKQPSKMPSAE